MYFYLLIQTYYQVPLSKALVSSSGLQQNCYRTTQKLIPFEIDNNNKVNSHENHDEGHCNNERPTRRAALEGEQLRKIRDLYY